MPAVPMGPLQRIVEVGWSAKDTLGVITLRTGPKSITPVIAAHMLVQLREANVFIASDGAEFQVGFPLDSGITIIGRRYPTAPAVTDVSTDSGYAEDTIPPLDVDHGGTAAGTLGADTTVMEDIYAFCAQSNAKEGGTGGTGGTGYDQLSYTWVVINLSKLARDYADQATDSTDSTVGKSVRVYVSPLLPYAGAPYNIDIAYSFKSYRGGIIAMDTGYEHTGVGFDVHQYAVEDKEPYSQTTNTIVQDETLGPKWDDLSLGMSSEDYFAWQAAGAEGLYLLSTANAAIDIDLDTLEAEWVDLTGMTP